jgi:phosphatidylserine decarboxylase
MQTVHEWLNRPDVREIQAASIRQHMEQGFFRDPMRPLYYRRDVFYAPADGFILYSRIIGSDERIVTVKGRNLTTQELLQDHEYSARSLVVGVFLTFYDVHVNRIPTDGYVHFRRPSATADKSMVAVEAGILRKTDMDPNDMEYAFTNERVVTRVYNPRMQQSYYLVQIADREVDTIALFAEDGAYLKQGQRFGAIRFGSQVDLIIPLTGSRWQFRSLVDGKSLYHVESGVDPLVRVEADGAGCPGR